MKLTKFLKEFFIPCQGNDHRPKALRSELLIVIVVIAVLIKLLTSSYLFFIWPNQASFSDTLSEEILALTNESRQAEGLSELTINPVLSSSAQAKAQDMIDKGYFSHISPDNKKPWEWIDRDQYDYLYAGENLAMDFVSAQGVYEALMNSPSHRNIILSKNYKDIGLGIITDEIDGKKVNVLVELFATPKTEAVSLYTETQETPLVEKEPEVSSGLTEQDQIIAETEIKGTSNIAETAVTWPRYIYKFFLVFLLIALIMNVLIKFHIQHKTLIFQSILAIVLTLVLLFIELHFLEGLSLEVII